MTEPDMHLTVLREIADYFAAEKPMLVTSDHVRAMQWAIKQLGTDARALLCLQANAYQARKQYAQKMNGPAKAAWDAAEALVAKKQAEIDAAEAT
jgi:hypothetical protein